MPTSGKDVLLHMLAVCLEVGIATRLLVHGDVEGLVLCVAYAWWSATFAMIARIAGRID